MPEPGKYIRFCFDKLADEVPNFVLSAACVRVRASRRVGAFPFCFLARLSIWADAYGDVADQRLEVVFFTTPSAFHVLDSARCDERSTLFVERSTLRSPVAASQPMSFVASVAAPLM